MLFFGHLGFTAGGARLYETASLKKQEAKLPDIDYRLVLVGSVLPDIIDKPIGALIFVGTFHNSRIFAHTLLFSLLLLIAGAVSYRRRKKTGLLILGLAALFHAVLDKPWVFPETFLWPFLNIKAALSAGDSWLGVLVSFPYKFSDWLEANLLTLLKNPTPFVFELLGLAILAYFFIRLLKQKRLKDFLRTGRL
jgi:hypothetical protein